MKELQDKIVKEGKILPGDIIKVDGFLNHRLDTALFKNIAKEFEKYFDISKVTLILTAEASGIALATVCGLEYNKPVLYAKKAKSDNIEGEVYKSEVMSYTYKKKVTFVVSKEWINKDDKVLIIDDFMANGCAVQGLVDLVHQAGATLLGIGIAIEKGFQKGGEKFRKSGVPYKALAVIDKVEDDGRIIFRDED